MTNDDSMALRIVEKRFSQRYRYFQALKKIANINNGPDRASGEYRCIEAAAIATEALAE